MNKRPSLQFYPADWMKDPDLQICSMNTIGIWINIMCRMWEAKEEGILRGAPGEIALLVGARPAEFKRFLREAVAHMFADVTKCDSVVTIKCRRMNRAFLEREGAKKRMQRHRNKPRNADVTILSSSSSSSSKIYTLQQCKDSAVLSGLTEQDAEHYFNHFNSQGWLKANKQPITNLQSHMAEWRVNKPKFEKRGQNGSSKTDRSAGQDRANPKPFIR